MEISISLDPAANKNLESYVKEMNAVLLSINEGRLSFHADVMDGKLVERAAISNEEYQFVAREALLPVDVHLMIHKPAERITDYLTVPPSPRYGKTVRSITFQIESVTKFEATRLLSTIQKAGFKAGIAIDLDTYIGSDLERIIEKCDLVVIMSVKAGKSGQAFNMTGLRKVSTIKKINPSIRVILDGGIRPNNIDLIKKAGVDTAVIGSYIYESTDKKNDILGLIKLIEAVKKPAFGKLPK